MYTNSIMYKLNNFVEAQADNATATDDFRVTHLT